MIKIHKYFVFAGLGALLISFSSCSFKEDNVIYMEYDITSKQYSTNADHPANTVLETYPVRMQLPENHGIVQVSLTTTKAMGTFDNVLNATQVMPEFQPIYTPSNSNALEQWEAFDTYLTMHDFIISEYDFFETRYTEQQAFLDAFAAAVIGARYAIYNVRLMDYNNQEIVDFDIPFAATTTITLSEKVKYIDVQSYLPRSPEEFNQKAGLGFVSYSNLHELSKPLDNDDNLLPELPMLSFLGNSNTSVQLSIKADGTLHGVFCRGDVITNENYTTVIDGKFSQIEKAGDGIYKMELDYAYSYSDGEIVTPLAPTSKSKYTVLNYEFLKNGGNFTLFLANADISLLSSDILATYRSQSGLITADSKIMSNILCEDNNNSIVYFDSKM